MVVAGPNRGSSFVIRQGENWIGRQQGCAVVLASSRISKRHCVLSVSEEAVTVSDPGSANGTFVNGALIRSRSLKIGDRISVGEFVLQLMEPARQRPAPNAVVLDPPNRGAMGQANSQFPAAYGRGGQAYALNPYANPEQPVQAFAQAVPQPGISPEAGPRIPT